MSKSDHLRGRAGEAGYLVLLAITMLTACAFPNWRDCLDGICSDPSRPFCDEDGAVSGLDHTCMAVACTAKSFAVCRADSAVVCDANGTNYDVVSCPLGCDAASSGCRECTNDQLCNAPRTVCDADTHLCRGCRIDDECESKACDLDAGACVAEGDVVYAAPTGFGRCLLSQPCQLSQAIDIAARSPTTIVRMLPGLYQTSIDLRTSSFRSISIIATGATVAPGSAPAITVTDGADLTIRGLATTAQFHVACGAANAMPSTVTLRDVSFTTLGDSSASVSVTRCKLTVASAELSMNAGELAIDTGDDATIIADRLYVHGENTPHILAHGTNVVMRMTNSIFDNTLLDLNTSDTAASGSTFAFAFDTFAVATDVLDYGVGPAAHQSVYFENSIIARAGDSDVIDGSNCRFANVMLSHQSALRPGTFVRDPMFVNITGHDLHLLPGSPAVDASVTPSDGLGSVHDFDGIARPQGAKPDLGAYELAPR